LAGGTALAQAAAVLVSPILTRIYDPADFGAFAVFTTILGIIVIAASLNYERAIPLPSDDVTAANLLSLSLISVSITSCLATLLLLLLGDQIAVWTNSPALRPYLYLLPIGVLVMGSFQVLNLWAVRKKYFVNVACSKIGNSLITISIQLGLGVLKFGVVGLLLGRVLGQSAGCGILSVTAWQRDVKALKGTCRSEIFRVARRYSRFAYFSMPSGLLTSAWLYLPPLILAVFYGPEVAGWFAVGQLALGSPVQLLADSVGQVYLAEAAKLARTAPIDMYRLYIRTASRLFALGILPVTLVAIGGPELFRFVFGPSWGETGLYVQVLSIMFLLRLTVVPVANTFGILERQDLALAFSVVRFIVNIGVLLGASWYGISPIIAILFYSISMALTYICHFLLMAYAIRTKFKDEMQSVNYLGVPS
jgi:O-antigen/teichoic acid export membrane protein